MKKLVYILVPFVLLTGCLGVGSLPGSEPLGVPIEVSGSVIDSKTGQPVTNIYIFTGDRNSYAISDQTGDFSLTFMSDKSHVYLRFEHLSGIYISEAVPLDLLQQQTFSLPPVVLQPIEERLYSVTGRVNYDPLGLRTSGLSSQPRPRIIQQTPQVIVEPVAEILIDISFLDENEILQLISDLDPARYELDLEMEILSVRAKDFRDVDQFLQEVMGHPLTSRVSLNQSVLSLGEITNLHNLKQWNMEKILMPLSWPLSEGSDTVRIAILDSGFDMSHSNLAANLGDSFAYNAFDGSDNVYEGGDWSHGTHVTGIAAADPNHGLAGIMPTVTIIPIKVLEGETGDSLSLARGIRHAIKEGADVINMSLGGTLDLGWAVRKEIQRAYDKGIVLVAAAGNLGYGDQNILKYPAAYPEVIAVGSTDYYNRVDPGSITDRVEIFAPGVEVYSTNTRGSYRYATGTSMATPHVSGLIGLLKAYRPELVDPFIMEEMLIGTGIELYPGSNQYLVNSHALLTQSYLENTIFKFTRKKNGQTYLFSQIVDDRELRLWLPAGNYTVEAFIDTDQNLEISLGEWSYQGSLSVSRSGSYLEVSLGLYSP